MLDWEEKGGCFFGLRDLWGGGDSSRASWSLILADNDLDLLTSLGTLRHLEVKQRSLIVNNVNNYVNENKMFSR